jgi:hypothetical protein
LATEAKWKIQVHARASGGKEPLAHMHLARSRLAGAAPPSDATVDRETIGNSLR